MRLFLLLFYLKIRYLWFLKLFNNAEDLCQAFLEKYPNCELIQNLLAETFKNNKKFDDAAIAYERLLEISRDEPMNYLDLIRALYQIKDYNKIIIIGEELVNKNFRGLRQSLKPIILSNVYWYLAYTYYYEKRYSNALLYFNKLLSLKVKNKIEYYPAIAECYLMLCDYSNSVKYCNLAISGILPLKRKALVYRTLGYSLQKMEKIEDSIDAYLKALELDNSLGDVHYNLSVIYGSLKRYDKAIHHLEIATNSYNDSKCFLELGNLYEKIGEKERASESYKKALELNGA